MSSPTAARPRPRRPRTPSPAGPGSGIAAVLNASAAAWSYPNRIRPLFISRSTMAVPWPRRGSRRRIVLEAGKEQVVLPGAVDAQIFAGEAFTAEPGLLEQADRRDVGGDAGRLDAMQPQRLERERNDELDRRRHVALARIGCPHPVAQIAGL